MQLRPVALNVTVDEPAIRLLEYVKRVPDKRGRSQDRRFMQMLVIRNGIVYEYNEDLGLASKYPGGPFVIISADEDNPITTLSDIDTVGEMRDMAVARRFARPFHLAHGVPQPDMVGSYQRAGEERHKAANHQSVFGAGFQKQRT